MASWDGVTTPRHLQGRHGEDRTHKAIALLRQTWCLDHEGGMARTSATLLLGINICLETFLDRH